MLNLTISENIEQITPVDKQESIKRTENQMLPMVESTQLCSNKVAPSKHSSLDNVSSKDDSVPNGGSNTHND